MPHKYRPRYMPFLVLPAMVRRAKHDHPKPEAAKTHTRMVEHTSPRTLALLTKRFFATHTFHVILITAGEYSLPFLSRWLSVFMSLVLNFTAPLVALYIVFADCLVRAVVTCEDCERLQKDPRMLSLLMSSKLSKGLERPATINIVASEWLVMLVRRVAPCRC